MSRRPAQPLPPARPATPDRRRPVATVAAAMVGLAAVPAAAGAAPAFEVAASVPLTGQSTIVGTTTVAGGGIGIVLSRSSPGGVSVVRDALGASPEVTDVDSGDDAFGLAVADIDGDGREELAVAEANQNRIVVFEQDLLGPGYTSRVVAMPDGTSPLGLTAGDVDGDGRSEFVVVGISGAVLTVSDDPEGSGDVVRQIASLGFTVPTDVRVADLDEDGRPEILVADAVDRTVAALSPRTDGTGYDERTVASGLSNVRKLAVGDVDGDDRPDLAVTDDAAGEVVVVPDGATGPPRTIRTGGTPAGISIADLDRDGRREIAVADPDGRQVLIAAKDPVGPDFSVIDRVAVGSQPYSVDVADVDADGRLDLVTANGDPDTASVLRNVTPRPLALAAPTTSGPQAVGTTGAPQAVEVTNMGDAAVSVARTTLSGEDASDFRVDLGSCADAPVAPRGTCRLAVRFAPAAPADRTSRSATLAVVPDVGPSSLPVALTGTVAAPAWTGGGAAPGGTGAPAPTPAPGPGAGAPTPGGPAAPPTGPAVSPTTPSLPAPTRQLRLERSSPSHVRATFECLRPTAVRPARCVVALSKGRGTRTVVVRITRNGRTVAAGRRVLPGTIPQRVEVFARRPATTDRYRIRITVSRRGERTQTLSGSYSGAPLGPR